MRPRSRIELDRRTAHVQHGMAVERLQLARRSHLHATIARIDLPARCADGEPRITLNGNVEQVVGLDELAGSPRQVGVTRGGERDRSRRASCDSKVSNLTSSARKPAVDELETLLAIVSRRRCRDSCADSDT